MAKGKYEEWLEPDSLLLISAWARDGLTDDQIANNMGISRSTLSEWKKKFPDISDALKKLLRTNKSERLYIPLRFIISSDLHTC